MTKGKSPIRDIRLILDNIRSVHNVGSIFRTADTLGISRIYCLETTPTPLDRFKNKRKDFAKVALGAEDSVSWEPVSGGLSLVSQLKKEGFTIVALEQASHSIDYKNVVPSNKVAIILGNEVDGVSKELLHVCDVVAEIPLVGEKESLNVSVSAGIFLYRLLDR